MSVVEVTRPDLNEGDNSNRPAKQGINDPRMGTSEPRMKCQVGRALFRHLSADSALSSSRVQVLCTIVQDTLVTFSYESQFLTLGILTWCAQRQNAC